MMMSKLDNLPKELVISILLVLPAEDLLVCKIVCKSLYSLITNPSFIAEYRKVSKKSCYILVKYKDSVTKDHVISLLSHETLEVVDTQRVLSDTQLMDLKWSKKNVILACCKGVLCLRYYRPHDAIVLWNPATRDAKLVPDRLYGTGPDNQILQRLAVGFGFDAKNNDHKLVSIQRLFIYKLFHGKTLYRPVQPCKQEVEVYSLKTGSWRLLTGNAPTFDFLSSCSGECSGGMFSWLVRSEEYGEHIISFDMSDEVFILTLLPPCLSHSNRGHHIELILHNGSLAIANHNFNEYNIWMLGKYGVKESWTNPFLIAFGPLERNPFFYWENTRVLLQDRDADCRVWWPILLDPTIKKRRDVDIRGTMKPMQAFNYQESRVRIHYNSTPN